MGRRVPVADGGPTDRDVAELIVHMRELTFGGYEAGARGDSMTLALLGMDFAQHATDLQHGLGHSRAKHVRWLQERILDPAQRRYERAHGTGTLSHLHFGDAADAPERPEPGRVDPITRRPRRS